MPLTSEWRKAAQVSLGCSSEGKETVIVEGTPQVILSANQISEIRLKRGPPKLQGPIRNSLPTD